MCTVKEFVITIEHWKPAESYDKSAYHKTNIIVSDPRDCGVRANVYNACGGCREQLSAGCGLSAVSAHGPTTHV